MLQVSIMDNVTKAGHQSEDNPLDFVLSDESVDRAGDVIRVKGWETSDFARNPIALFGHAHDQIIGTWKNVRVEGKKLMGTLSPVEPGTSALADTVISLIKQRVLRAVSVGFAPVEANPRKGGGYEFTKASLHEVSVVAVPCNANALAVKMVKATNPDLVDLLFAKSSAEAVPELDGQLTQHELETPNLDAARTRLKALGIDY